MSTITTQKSASEVVKAPEAFRTMVLGTSVIDAICDAEEAGELSAKTADKIRAKVKAFWMATRKSEKKASTRNYPVGLTITGISSQKWEDDDINDTGSLVALELSDGSFLYPQQDEEGNGPGTLCSYRPKAKKKHFQFFGGDKLGLVCRA